MILTKELLDEYNLKKQCRLEFQLANKDTKYLDGYIDALRLAIAFVLRAEEEQQPISSK